MLILTPVGPPLLFMRYFSTTLPVPTPKLGQLLDVISVNAVTEGLRKEAAGRLMEFPLQTAVRKELSDEPSCSSVTPAKSKLALDMVNVYSITLVAPDVEAAVVDCETHLELMSFGFHEGFLATATQAPGVQLLPTQLCQLHTCVRKVLVDMHVHLL